ncbi:guanylate kinase (plasmid) [Azospirillum argentinense]|uniref:Guanylate kinase n=3 Tax=Azospirillum TaxID=191 RepID=A0A060DSI8_9PROT|nr:MULTISPECIES: guanylate kinase [Azospirillum]AIB14143.1 guanylate kinase [Azospirillum argentinense]EZQ05610.1 guanylate kinase [Azospirillum argentinense]KAA1055164.1 Guanylate kinase [Azospirillum argentinense]QCO16443.1 guanylate kinase [Azospirillum brasilense]
MPETMNTKIARRGLMLVLSSPSGAGKTTISRRLLDRDPGITLSVSVTTRPMRPGEQPGVHYYFVDMPEFDRMAGQGELLEHARVFGNCYGTPRHAVETALSAGRDVLFDIDWQGMQQLAANARADLVSVFVLPPSGTELERRLHSRGQDSAEVIAQRMAKASDEISHWGEYDYVIVNNDVDESVTAVQAILRAERLRRTRQVGMPAFVESVQAAL